MVIFCNVQLEEVGKLQETALLLLWILTPWVVTLIHYL